MYLFLAQLTFTQSYEDIILQRIFDGWATFRPVLHLNEDYTCLSRGLSVKIKPIMFRLPFSNVFILDSVHPGYFMQSGGVQRI